MVPNGHRGASPRAVTGYCVEEAAIAECIRRLAEDRRHPGLRVHRVEGAEGVWEAYVDDKNRLAFHIQDDTIVLRNHCNHDILKRRP